MGYFFVTSKAESMCGSVGRSIHSGLDHIDELAQMVSYFENFVELIH